MICGYAPTTADNSRYPKVLPFVSHLGNFGSSANVISNARKEKNMIQNQIVNFFIDDIPDINNLKRIDLLRSIAIKASIDDVFVWLSQFRVAPYSYDFLDNEFHASPNFVIKNLTPLRKNTHFLLAFNIVSFENNLYIAIRFCEPILFPFNFSIESLFMEYRVVSNGKETILYCKISAFIKKGLFSNLFFSFFLFLNKIMMERQFSNVKELAEKLSKGEIICKTYPFSENNLRKGLIWFLFCRRKKCPFLHKYDSHRVLSTDACKCTMNKQ